MRTFFITESKADAYRYASYVNVVDGVEKAVVTKGTINGTQKHYIEVEFSKPENMDCLAEVIRIAVEFNMLGSIYFEEFPLSLLLTKAQVLDPIDPVTKVTEYIWKRNKQVSDNRAMWPGTPHTWR